MPAETFFAAKLRSLIGERGLTAAALTRQSGVSKQSVSALLAGQRRPSWETVQRLAAALGVPTDTFRDPAACPVALVHSTGR